MMYKIRTSTGRAVHVHDGVEGLARQCAAIVASGETVASVTEHATQADADGGSRGQSAEGAARAQAARTAFAQAASATPNAASVDAVLAPVYTMGALLRADGVDRAREIQETHASKATLAADLTARIIAPIEAERREQIPLAAFVQIPLADLKPVPSQAAPGQLLFDRDCRVVAYAGHVSVAQRLTVEPQSRGDVASALFGAPSARSYLAACPPELAAQNLNHWARSTAIKGGEAPSIVARTRVGYVSTGEREERSICAVVSDRYTPYDGDQVARDVLAAFPGDAWRMGDATKYNPASLAWLIDVEAVTDVKPEEWCAGEAFRFVYRVDSRDDGTRGIRGSWGVQFNRCLNVIIVQDAKVELKSVRHGRSVRERIAAQLRDARKGAETIFAHVREAKSVQLVDAIEASDEFRHLREPGGALRYLSDGLLTSLFGNVAQEREFAQVLRKKDAPELVRAYHDARNAPTKGTVAGVVDAITLFSQSQPERRVDLDRAASRFLARAASHRFAA